MIRETPGDPGLAGLPLADEPRTGPGASSATNLGGVAAAVNGRQSTPVENLVDTVWNAPRRLWNRTASSVHSAVQDTPGRCGDTRADLR
jgi:hypothetical protein